jgi:invasion protein IalB
MTFASRLAVVALASLFATGTAFAQTAAPAAKSDTKTTTAAPTDKKAPKEHSAESLECSKQADAKGLKGKERKKFRRECMKEAKAGTAAPAADKK